MVIVLWQNQFYSIGPWPPLPTPPTCLGKLVNLFPDKLRILSREMFLKMFFGKLKSAKKIFRQFFITYVFVFCFNALICT